MDTKIYYLIYDKDEKFIMKNIKQFWSKKILSLSFYLQQNFLKPSFEAEILFRRSCWRILYSTQMNELIFKVWVMISYYKKISNDDIFYSKREIITRYIIFNIYQNREIEA